MASVGTKWCKSCLHDDITVVILDFTSAAGGTAKTDVAATLSADAAPASILAARQAFAALDTSGDGQLTAADVVAAGQAMGQPLSMEQADGFLAAADLDGSGSVGRASSTTQHHMPGLIPPPGPPAVPWGNWLLCRSFRTSSPRGWRRMPGRRP